MRRVLFASWDSLSGSLKRTFTLTHPIFIRQWDTECIYGMTATLSCFSAIICSVSPSVHVCKCEASVPLCFHICWRYGPLLQRPILLFTSAHSKLVKRAIVQSCFSNALERSCEHVSKASLLAQSKHLEEAGHPCPSLVSVARAMCRKRKTYSCQ